MDSREQDSIESRLAVVRARIGKAARQAGRRPEAVTLVAVSKTHGPEAVAAALAAGQTVFGENRVQEAQAKYPDIQARHPELRLHLIGPLQSNKAGDAVRLFDCIETLDRPKLARALAKEMAKAGRRPDCLIQVNTGEEPQKAGVRPEGAAELIRLVRDELALPLKGLMCIPPIDETPAPHFALLRELAKAAGLPWLSMGMSGDFETAIRFGATHVRVGTAVFGARAPQA
ncbi:MAG: YggS family pyridoxal phosphate-dependent enzyme [Kiloniellales bacterium]|nr:YggS family pyridoxal phosphate-dependent enzyme [Kiloniellales bacterium]